MCVGKVSGKLRLQTIGPRELQLIQIIIASIRVWIVEVMCGSPAASLCQTENDDAKPPHIRNVGVCVVTASISHVNNQIGVQ